MKVRFSPELNDRIKKSKPEGFWKRFSDLNSTLGGELMKKHEVIHFYKSGGFNHLVNVSVDDNLFAAVTFTDSEVKRIEQKYPLAKDNLFALVDGVEIKLKS